MVLSPDGQWVVYQAQVATRTEIFVEPIPTSGARHQVTVDGGSQPVWARSGKELFYFSNGSIWVASVVTTPTMAVMRRDSLFAIELPASSGPATYDVMPDGNAFVAAKLEVMTPVLVTGWFTQLRARMDRAARK